MKFLISAISIICLFANVSFAQKHTRKNPRSKTVFQNTKSPADSKQTDSPVKILYKPRAAYPNQDNGTVCIQGTVNLRVEFLETAEIGEIKIVSGLPYGATESAIEAAKNINFEPAVKNGKPVTSTKIVQFSFSIY